MEADMSERDTPILKFRHDMTDKEQSEVFANAKNQIHGMVADVLADAEFKVPEKKDFEGKEFMEAPELKKIGEFLIDKYLGDFDHLVDANIVYLWKEKGGDSGGKATLGKCVRPTGLAAHFAAGEDIASRVHYVIWAAADHLRLNRANVRTIHALIFHELLHTHLEDGKLIVRSHQFEGFAREIEEFGMWTNSIKRIAEACETVKDVQVGLFTNLA
jgi:hypothetical protein